MGAVLDGVADHMDHMPADRAFVTAKGGEPTKDDVVQAMRDAKADILVNFLPVGSQEATEFYMECALEAGVGVVNCMPVFIASEPGVGAPLPRQAACRSSATTSRPRSAPPSSTAPCPT